MATTTVTPKNIHTEILAGHCFCGKCTYTINPNIQLTGTQERFITEFGTNILPFHDHCSDCRRATSGLLTSYFIIPPPYISFGLNSPLKAFRSSKDTVERTFCSDCGTHLTYQRLNAQQHFGTIDVAIGTLCEADLQKLDELGLTPTKLHVWWGDGVGWYQKEVLRSAEENQIRAFKGGNLKPELEVTDVRVICSGEAKIEMTEKNNGEEGEEL